MCAIGLVSELAFVSLYSICCSVNDHCKYDTIFVSCAAGAGPDDYSGVIAGLQENGQASEQAEDEVDVEQGVADTAAEEVADTEEEDEAKVTGGQCTNRHNMKVWKRGGKQQYDAAMDHCGTSCAAGFPCTKSCMQKHGYSSGCAGCMAHAVECGRDHRLSQCISNHKSKGCLHCNKKKCRPVMKRCSGWNVGGH